MIIGNVNESIETFDNSRCRAADDSVRNGPDFIRPLQHGAGAAQLFSELRQWLFRFSRNRQSQQY